MRGSYEKYDMCEVTRPSRNLMIQCMSVVGVSLFVVKSYSAWNCSPVSEVLKFRGSKD